MHAKFQNPLNSPVMATSKMFQVTIREKEKNKKGEVNIKLRVVHNRKTRDIGSDYYVLPEYFDKKAGMVIAGGPYSKEDAAKINLKMQIQLGIAAEKAGEQRNLKNMDIGSLMNILRDKHRNIDFFAVTDMIMEKHRKEGKHNYVGLYKRIRKHVQEFARTPVLHFETIDYGFLTRLESNWRYFRKIKDSSIGFYMRGIRKIWNEGRKMGLVDESRNPFKNYTIPKGDPREIEVLNPDEMAAIAKTELKEPLMRWCRDMAMLSFCLIGINPKDMFFIDDISGGRLPYKRSKGKKRYSIKIPPQALHIIKRYPGKKYLIDGMDRYSDYRSANKRIDYKLKDIAKMCGITKNVNYFTFRHSWSAYARYLGVSMDDISAALGHKRIDLPAVTEFYNYVAEEQRRVDLANKKVIRLILRTPPMKPKE